MARRTLFLAVLWACLLPVVACAGGGDGQDALDGGRDAADLPGERGDVPGAGDEAGEAACWVLASPADAPDDPAAGIDVVMAWNARRNLRVRAEACGQPVAGAAVTWGEVDDPDNLCVLEVATTTADGDGLSVAGLIASGPGTFGECEVEACTGQGPCARLRIRVGTPCGAPLAVSFAPYTGHRPDLDTGTVFLYLQQANGRPKCADVPPENTTVTATDKKGPTSLASSVVYAKLPAQVEGVAQTYTVRCFASHGTGAARAYGCLDDVQVEHCKHTAVTCPLADIPPKLVGQYDLASTLDLMRGLPPTAEAVMNLLIQALSEPLPVVMKLVCDPAVARDGTPARPFCQSLFQDPANPDLDGLTAVGEVVARRIRANLEALPLYACGADGDPATCPGLDPGIFGPSTRQLGLGAVELGSTLTCTQEPGAGGVVPPGGCCETWHTASLRGLPGAACPSANRWCRDVDLSLSALATGGGAVTAALDVVLDADWRLSVARHDVGLRYGALVDLLEERGMVPALFGDGKDGQPAVESWEAWIASLLSGRGCLQSADCCQTFGTALAAGAPGVVAEVAQAACDQWVTQGGAWLRAVALGLDQAPTALRLGTPAGSPCAMEDANDDMRFDALGTAAAPCTWEAEWALGAAFFGADATFTGTRQ